MLNPREDIDTYLRSWFATSKHRQEVKNGNQFTLTYSEFLSLWGPRRLRELAKRKDEGRLYSSQCEDNPNAYVLTWKSFAARQTGVMSFETAQVVTRGRSREANKMGKGDKHSTKSRQRISASKSGIPQSAEHRANRSAAMKGKNTRPMSEEQKQARREAAVAYWANKRGETTT